MRTTFIFMFPLLLLISCTQQSKDANTNHEHADSSVKYTCSMHPQIIRDKPGSCPICGMALVKIEKSSSANNALMLSDRQIKLANITTQTVSMKPIGQAVTINGRLTIDEQQSQVISSRVAGRIEKLYVKETGHSIEKGEPLYIIYSEALLTLQQEYLLAKEQYQTLGQTEMRYKSLLDAAEKKLLLYGLTKNQINKLTDNESLQSRVTFLAPSTGIITEINVAEGQYITEGSALYNIEDIAKLWVEAELYPKETSLMKIGDEITVNINGENPIVAQVTFMSPEYRANTQITIMRAAIDNRDLKFKPGQQAQVYINHSSNEALAIPVDAVIRDEKGAHVYVQAGHNTFEPRMVKPGLESKDQVEILEGIKEGDTVVVSGAYLLYSEIILKTGSEPMAEHQH